MRVYACVSARAYVFVVKENGTVKDCFLRSKYFYKDVALWLSNCEKKKQKKKRLLVSARTTLLIYYVMRVNTTLFDSSDTFSSAFCEVGENENRPEVMSNLWSAGNLQFSYAKNRSDRRL